MRKKLFAKTLSFSAKTDENNSRILNNVRGIPQRKGGKIDFALFAVFIALALFGLVMVLSTTPYANELEGKSPFSAFIKQAILCGLGTAVMIVIMCFDDYAWIKSWTPLFWVLGVLSLLLVMFVGSETNGAGRWISIGGFTLQPSEFVKYTVIVSLAAWIHTCPFPAKNPNKRKQYAMELLRYIIQLMCFAIPVLLIFLQPAMSMALVISAACMLVILISGMDWVKLGVTVFAGVGAVIMGILAEDFRRERLLSYFSQNSDSLGTGMQPTQAKYALASGNLFGKSMNYSRQKYDFLPEAETDFIFAIIGEEYGFVGILFLVAAYAFIFWRGMQIAQHARCRFGAYSAAGITFIITLQALMNMMVATGIIPVTGQALPLISQGGSAMLSHMAACGLLLNISKDRYE